MSTRFRNRTLIKILGIIRILATVAFSWLVAIVATPPNKPVENGLEVIFPGFLILLLGTPSILIGIGLIKGSEEAVRLGLYANIAAIAFIALAISTTADLYLTIFTLPLIIDSVLLIICKRSLQLSEQPPV